MAKAATPTAQEWDQLRRSKRLTTSLSHGVSTKLRPYSLRETGAALRVGITLLEQVDDVAEEVLEAGRADHLDHPGRAPLPAFHMVWISPRGLVM